MKCLLKATELASQNVYYLGKPSSFKEWVQQPYPCYQE